MKLDVLLTDGHFQHTYAILRALVKKKLSVGILFNRKTSLSLFSKYVSKPFFVKSSIYDNEVLYFKEVLHVLRNNDIKVLLPIGNITHKIVSKYKYELEKYTNIPVVNYDKMKIAQNKRDTFEFAEKIKVPIPITYDINSIEELEMISKKISYPNVIKKVKVDESGVIYCNNSKELISNYNEYVDKSDEKINLPIVQEYVKGKGVGFYGLFNEGKCEAYFIHKRIHEYPITGGSSTFAKSNHNEKLKNLGIKILSELDWHGVAMVEFKESNDNNFFLMEINPKFWGSLELSYVAGINFPYLTYLLALNMPIPKSTYKRNIYFRWIFPFDLMWKKFSTKEQRLNFKSIKKKENIMNNLHFDDPITLIYNFIFYIYSYFHDRKYPHSKVVNNS